MRKFSIDEILADLEGFCVSGGGVTFPNADTLRDLAAEVTRLRAMNAATVKAIAEAKFLSDQMLQLWGDGPITSKVDAAIGRALAVAKGDA